MEDTQIAIKPTPSASSAPPKPGHYYWVKIDGGWEPAQCSTRGWFICGNDLAWPARMIEAVGNEIVFTE